MAGGNPRVRTYLVVIDDSAEARVALRFSARRAAKTRGNVEVLAIVPPQDFVQWGGVQAAIEEEQKLRIEGVVSSAVGEIFDEAGIKPAIVLRQGEPVTLGGGMTIVHGSRSGRSGRNRPPLSQCWYQRCSIAAGSKVFGSSLIETRG